MVLNQRHNKQPSGWIWVGPQKCISQTVGGRGYEPQRSVGNLGGVNDLHM